MLEPGSFNVHKNTVIPIIVILDHLELNTEVSDIGIETAESDDCREMSGKDGDANGMLATIQEGVRFFCKDEWKFIDLFT